jgi:hypothetical protein
MPKFKVCARRDYVNHEVMSATVEADSPEEALAKAKRLEAEDGLEGSSWSEEDGGADPSSYQWEVCAPGPGGAVLARGEGAYENEDAVTVAGEDEG